MSFYCKDKSGSKDFASRSFKRQPDHAARDIKGEVMGLRHREYDVKGLQFHLESILAQHGKEMMKRWLEP